MRNYDPRIWWALVGFVVIITVAVILWESISPGYEPVIVWGNLLVTILSIRNPKLQKPVRWINVIIFGFSLAWLVAELRKNGLNIEVGTIEAFIGVMICVMTRAISVLAPSYLNVAADLLRLHSKKRKELIQRAKEIWIDGVLAGELKSRPIMPIRFKLDYPESNRLVTYADLEDAFRLANGRLLLVGDAGSGKTFASLQLTQMLLKKAEQDEDAPVPLIFPLGNWGQHKLPLDEWLLSEMESSSLYRLNRDLAQAWIVDGKRIIWLLDGLDQVPEDLRLRCLSALNLFCNAYPHASIIICSRLAEYEALQLRPKLNRVIELIPLTTEQIQSYIGSLAIDLTALQNQLEADSGLLDLAQNRLMLWLMCDVSPDFTKYGSLGQLTQDELHRRLLSLYVDKSFQRHATSIQYSQDYLRRRLSWLAWKMREQQELLFLIERIHFNWLPDRVSQIIYRLMLIPVLATGWMSYGIAAGLIETFIIFWFLIASSLLLENATPRLVDYLFAFALVTPAMAGIISLMGGLSFANLVALIGGRAIPFEDWEFSVPNSLRGLLLGIVVGLLAIGLISIPWYSEMIDWPITLIEDAMRRIFGEESSESLVFNFLFIIYSCSVFILTGSLIAGITYAVTFIVRKLRPNLQEVFRYMLVGGIIGLLSGLAATVIVVLQEAPGFNLSGRLLVGTILCSMFTSAIMEGFSIKLAPDTKIKTRRRNLGIWQSLVPSITVTAIFVSVVIIVVQLWIPWSLLKNIHVWMPSTDEDYIFAVYISRLVIIAFVPPALGTAYGGLAIVQHFAVRGVLAFIGYMPMRIGRFLEDACKIGILQRVGGAYQFRHQVFLEHFADLYRKR